jgi:hypothetical protein
MMSVPSSFQKFRGLSWPDRALLVESFAWLAIASLAIAVLPFPSISAIASRGTRLISAAAGARQDLVSRIRWAVGAASARVPWRAVCFQQGLAAHLMLRRRGIDSVLYYGAAHTPDSALSAHVWVRAGDLDVVGCELASQYALLATFPSERPRAASA